MQLLLIRHGQSINNLSFAQTGVEDSRHPDPELTPQGLRQAEYLGQAFGDGRLPRPDLLMSSLMLRAVQTVAPISAALDMPVIGDSLIYEVKGVHSGVPGSPAGAQPHPGASATQLRAIAPRLQLPADADESGWYHSPVETPAQAWRRAQAVVDGVGASFGDTDHLIAIVTHGWFEQYLIRAFVGWPAEPNGRLAAWMDTYNTSTTLLQCPDPTSTHSVAVCWLNRTDHLPRDMVTM
jgi:2,3-bisphosphoglycerate-dependent phosphoglycerate mutase